MSEENTHKKFIELWVFLDWASLRYFCASFTAGCDIDDFSRDFGEVKEAFLDNLYKDMSRNKSFLKQRRKS